MHNFDFLEKGLGLPSHYILYMIFQEKYFHVYSINRQNFTVSLPLLLETLGNMCIIYFPVCDFTNFEINLSFLIKSFSYVTKKVRAKIQTP